jgi:predicted Rossmann-fold nucleotide-binding protein
VAGYFDELIKFLDHAVAEGFLTEEHREMIMVEADPGRLLERMRAFAPTEGGERLMGRTNR